jgi:transglycosylase-like protein
MWAPSVPPALPLAAASAAREVRRTAAVHPKHGGESHVRKLIATVCAMSILGVPAAFAATAEEGRQDSTKLVASTVLDKHWKQTKHELRKAKREARKAESAPKVSIPPQLESIAACESGGNPRSVSASGMYRGKYQFSRETWAAVGGQGDPAAAPEAEQDRRAATLYQQSGPGQWPVCGS